MEALVILLEIEQPGIMTELFVFCFLFLISECCQSGPILVFPLSSTIALSHYSLSTAEDGLYVIIGCTNGGGGVRLDRT